MTQGERVLNYLQENGSITVVEAYEELGITALSAVIFNLRRKKHFNIKSKNETGLNKCGVKTTYSRYYFKENKEGAKV